MSAGKAGALRPNAASTCREMTFKSEIFNKRVRISSMDPVGKVGVASIFTPVFERQHRDALLSNPFARLL